MGDELTMGRFLAAIALMTRNDITKPEAITMVGDVCQSLGIDPKLPMKTQGDPPATNGCTPGNANADTLQALVTAGVRFSGHPATSKFAVEGNKPRYCRFAAGGCGAELPPASRMYYQTEGPKGTIQSGQYKGKEFNYTLGPACYEALQAKVEIPAEEPAPAAVADDEDVPF